MLLVESVTPRTQIFFGNAIPCVPGMTAGRLVLFMADKLQDRAAIFAIEKHQWKQFLGLAKARRAKGSIIPIAIRGFLPAHPMPQRVQALPIQLILKLAVLLLQLLVLLK